ncbi:MAG: hypothetical protein WA160_01445 [Pseudobdellovibrio sp.]
MLLELIFLILNAVFVILTKPLSNYATAVVTNISRLKIRFFTSMLCCFFIFSNNTLAASVVQVQRQELFLRAYNSLAFLLIASKQDVNFYKSLTFEEKTMLSGIYQITNEVTVLNWFKKNNVHRYGSKPKFIYAYTITKNRTVQVITDLENPAQLQFSNDQSIFNLNPEEPNRTAMTKDSLEADIFINLNKINDPEQTVDLATATSLLIHEFGHKLVE